jgi:hypothetical protein
MSPYSSRGLAGYKVIIGGVCLMASGQPLRGAKGVEAFIGMVMLQTFSKSLKV